MIKTMKFILTGFLLLIFYTGFSQKQVDPDAHVLLNTKAPLFAGKTLDGKDFSLHGNKGKIVVLHFWSFTCGVCFKEIPELNAINKLYGNKNVVVVGLLQESREEALKKITVQDGKYTLKKKAYFNDMIDYQIVPDMKEVMTTYQSDGIFPKLFVIDEKGVIKAFSDGYMMSYGNPKTEETENYKVLKEKIELVINSKK